MSNAAFDRLDKAVRLREAKAHLAEWRKSRARTDLSETDKVWLDRAIVASEQNVRLCEEEARRWWA